MELVIIILKRSYRKALILKDKYPVKNKIKYVTKLNNTNAIRLIIKLFIKPSLKNKYVLCIIKPSKENIIIFINKTLV
jgi:ATP-dependent RNA circularization protein (DNA/RNA ligase family)